MDSYHPATLAVTGATGALGVAFLQYLFRRDARVHARLLVRQSSASFQSEAFQNLLCENRQRVTLIEGDVRQLDARQLDPLLGTDGGLWHFAALTSLSHDSESVAREIREVNAAATQRLVAACLGSSGRGPFHHISTAYVLGKRTGIAYESESAMNQEFRNPYEASKLEAELSLQRGFAKGLTGAIYRPSVVADDTAGTGGFKIFDACAYAVALAVKRGEPFVFRLPVGASINLVHSDWVIAAMLDLARLASDAGYTYHLAAPGRTSFHRISVILDQLVPGLKTSFEPGLKRSDLPTASKIFDKAITDIRPYFEAEVDFDRTNVERDLSRELKEMPMDLAPFVESRLQAEITRKMRRR